MLRRVFLLLVGILSVTGFMGCAAEGFDQATGPGVQGSAAAPLFPIERAPAPLFEDELWHGAADPSVLWNPANKEFAIYYTQRRAALKNGKGVEWVHGSAIGLATSKDGVTWTYRGICTGDAGLGTPMESGVSWWAPSVHVIDGTLHMFVTRVDGVYTEWIGKRAIMHFTSADGRTWKYRQTLPLSSEHCIDPCVARIGGRWVVWYKDEKHGNVTWAAESSDLKTWTVRGPAVKDVPHEAPCVWRWKGAYWMIVDAWGKGLRIYRSKDGLDGWEYSSTILLEPGRRPRDGVQGGHPGILVQGERAFVFYHVHFAKGPETVLQVAELEMDEAGKVTCDRDRYAGRP